MIGNALPSRRNNEYTINEYTNNGFHLNLLGEK